MADYKKLLSRFQEAKNYKLRWLALYKDLYDYVIPDRNGFNELFGYQDPGLPTTNQVWDNTAMLAAYQRANDLHGLLLPKDRVWGKLVLDPHKYEANLIEQAQPLMDTINERIFHFLNQSNLARVVSSSNLDLVGGTAAIWVESHSDDVPLYFRSISAVALFIEYSTDDVINTCWFSKKMNGHEILETFPDYNGSIKNTLVDNPNDLYMINYGQVRLEEDRFFIYAVLDEDPYHPLFEVERPYNQIIIYRDRVRPGEAEGRGVGMDLLPTIRDLNRVVEYSRKSMALKAYPPMFYDAGSYVNPYSIRQWAGAMIARNPQGRDPISVLQTPDHPEVLAQIQHLQDVIQKGFQVDPLGEINSPVKTATEISIRENRAQRTSATDISRLINELPKQIFDVCSLILNDRGLLTKQRESIPGFSTKHLKFDYVSPLYDLQNQEEINHFVSNCQIKQQFWGEGAVIASTNLGEVNKFLTEKFRLPSKLFKTDEEIQQFMQQMAQQQQQAALPQSSTGASPVNLPEAPGVTI